MHGSPHFGIRIRWDAITFRVAKDYFDEPGYDNAGKFVSIYTQSEDLEMTGL